MRNVKWLLLLVLVTFAFGCAGQTWQVKSTNVAVGTGYGVIVAANSVKPPCDQGIISADNCSKLKTQYAIAVSAYRFAVSDLKLALSTTDAIQRKALLEQTDVLLVQFVKATNDLVDLYQKIIATQTGTQLPVKSKLAVTPELIQIIAAVLQAMINIAPDIISWISGWSASPDIPALIKQLDDAVARVPVWT